MFYVIQSLGSGPATAGPRRESARGISSPCSVYGKGHCLAGRQMLHPRHKVKKLKAACGSSAPSRIGPVAWCLQTGRVDRPLAQTIRQPPPCFIVGTMHCGLYLLSTLLRTIACFAPQKSRKALYSDHSSVSHCWTVQFSWRRAKSSQLLMFAGRNNGFFTATQPRSPAEFRRFLIVEEDTVTPSDSALTPSSVAVLGM